MKIIVLDGRKMTDRESAHTYLKKKLELPEHYGKNLDALYDVLGECGAEMNILLRGEAAGAEMAAYLPRLESVLSDCADEGMIGGFARK